MDYKIITEYGYMICDPTSISTSGKPDWQNMQGVEVAYSLFEAEAFTLEKALKLAGYSSIEDAHENNIFIVLIEEKKCQL
tara:strand:- start:256 stop:495 length:240 start_codon:yes stop_codon:yes gene_type:complete